MYIEQEYEIKETPNKSFFENANYPNSTISEHWVQRELQDIKIQNSVRFDSAGRFLYTIELFNVLGVSSNCSRAAIYSNVSYNYMAFYYNGIFSGKYRSLDLYYDDYEFLDGSSCILTRREDDSNLIYRLS